MVKVKIQRRYGNSNSENRSENFGFERDERSKNISNRCVKKAKREEPGVVAALAPIAAATTAAATAVIVKQAFARPDPLPRAHAPDQEVLDTTLCVMGMLSVTIGGGNTHWDKGGSSKYLPSVCTALGEYDESSTRTCREHVEALNIK
uniref:Uncharacterized protein n=1 Tax=Vespula pensylvanica TaxID=30213 RepID=A0A834P3I5_VESPE|nr:hypothetical protein H0235_008232 [Vespula pensylvanica]